MFYGFIYLAKGFRMRPKVRPTLKEYLVYSTVIILNRNSCILCKQCTVDPDQMLCYVVSDLGQHCLPRPNFGTQDMNG